MHRARPALIFLLNLFLLTFSLSAAAQTSTRPFILPVAAPPGPNTWLLGQPYGNTIGAFLRGTDWYSAGQRLHFGIDLSMRCGTELVAIDDGTVVFVDDRGFGSGPHNLLIRHDNVGLVSLYGHLLERPALVPGQFVRQGEVIAYSGDPDITCDSRPHLHLEIRSLDYRSTYNPVDYIEANWHNLAVIGSFRYPLFQQDLDNARQWMTLDDQPVVHFGGRALNLYEAPYPDLRHGEPPVNPPLARDLGPLPDAPWSLRRLGFDGCCVNAQWHPTDANRIYLIDGSAGQRASIFEWNTDDGSIVNLIGQAPPPGRSPDANLEITREGNGVRIRRTDGSGEWTVDTMGAHAAISPDNQRLLWQVASQIASPGQSALPTSVWISGVDGADAREVLVMMGGNAQWLDSERLLLTSREGIVTTLATFNPVSGESVTLGSFSFLRTLTIAPGGGRLMFYVVNQPDPANSGIYTLRTEAGAVPERLPWFGGWRWRDDDTVYYIPLDPAQNRQRLHYFDLTTGEDRPLTDISTLPFVVANGDWSVSADGDQIAFWSALDRSTWLLEMN
ncbi:M23 family metallopeptidase [Kamptonema cortianum]|nr:M23 family metallopeptidase [Kamptonema cortianum]